MDMRHKLISTETLEAMKTFDVRDDDTWLITYPKSGTTWTSEIMNRILQVGREEFIPSEKCFYMYPEFSFPDRKPLKEEFDGKASPRVFVTHLPGEYLPTQLCDKNSKAKIIYVLRNPKDVAVSYFFHQKVDPNLQTSYSEWSTFYDDFIKGEVAFGNWADHAIYWWKRRDQDNVLFLTYENMSKDLRENVKRIMTFLGEQLSDDMISEIEKLCSFGSMKKQNIHEFLVKNVFKSDMSQSPFVRKGKVASWKEFFTVAQNEEFDHRVYPEWIGDSDMEVEFQ